MSPLPLSLFAMISIAGCAPIASQDPPPGTEATPEPEIRVGPGLEDGACRAEAAQRFVGRMPDEDTVREAMAASGAATVRVIAHDTMVTMDYRGDRLNLRLDESGRIAAIACG
ncbi:MAG: I78 family peptidase inhibitor [Pseudomonadota bacterium]